MQVNSKVCTGTPHELVVVAWQNDPLGNAQCIPGAPPFAVSWYALVFDNTANLWSTNYVAATTAQWSPCVSVPSPDQSTFPAYAYNADSPNPYLAANGPYFAWTHSESTPIGSRIRVESWMLHPDCNNGTWGSSPRFSRLSPDYCYLPGNTGWCNPPPGNQGGGNGPGGTNIVNDQWNPQIAFLQKGSNPELLVTWYDTSGDPNNSLVRVNGAMSTAGFSASPFQDVNNNYTINTLSRTSPTLTVAWNNLYGAFFDYQGIAVDYKNAQSFFAAWGGDGRGVSPCSTCSDGEQGMAATFGATVTYP